MLPQLAWGDCSFVSAFLSCQYSIERCSDTLSQPQTVVLWLRLWFPQMCTAGWGTLVVRLGSGLGWRAAALVRAQTAPQHKGCGFEGLRFSCRLEGVFVHVSIDFCCCVWFGFGFFLFS